MKNTVFIFGAGASAGCLDTELVDAVNKDFCPPVTRNIFGTGKITPFNSIIKKYPSLSSLVPEVRQYLRTDPNPDLEQYISDLIDKSEERPHLKIQLLDLRYYLRALLKECSEHYLEWGSNYSRLINQLRLINSPDTEITFVTFNYDHLIEGAFIENKMIESFDTLDSYKDLEFPFIKLHGSADWVYKVPYEGSSKPELTASSIIAPEAELYAHLLYEIENRNMDYKRWHVVGEESGYLYVPAISIPTHGKIDFECPLTHVAKLRTSLFHAEVIVCIGWKGEEDLFAELCTEVRTQRDEHDMTPVQKLIVVSQTEEGAKKIMAEMHNKFPFRQGKCIGGGFSGFLKEFTGEKLNKLLSDY